MTSKHNRRDAWMGAVFLVLGLGAYFVLIPVGIDIPKTSDVRALSPDFWPSLIVLSCIAASVIVLFQATLSNPGEGRSFMESEEDPGFRNAGERTIRTAALLLTFLLFYLILPFLGFVVASSIVLFSMMMIFGERRHLLAAAVSILLPVCLYLFFRYVAGIPIPLGIFGNLI